MNVLDENVPASQHALLRNKRVAFQQIGYDLGRKGMKDDELIPFLHRLNLPTFFTLDDDFYDRRLRHERYCLVYLDVDEELIAEYMFRLLRHHELNTKAKRMGRVIRVFASGFAFWQIRHDQEVHVLWS